MNTTGMLSVLNVGAGDIELKFNPHQPEELARALRMLKDMQRRGYAILVREPDGSYVRATGVDAERGLYIISGEPKPALEAENPVVYDAAYDVAAPPPALPPATPEKKRRRMYRTAPVATSEAVSLGRSAGG